MKDKILKRLQELSEEMEQRVAEREAAVEHLHKLDNRIRVISILIPELKELSEEEEKKD